MMLSEEAAMAEPGVAVVTGAGSGLGRCISVALLGAGWRVAAAGRREAALRETLDGASAPDGAALAVPADVTEPESVAALFAAVRSRWGRRGPAGQQRRRSSARPARWMRSRWQDWRRAVDTNLTGAFLCAQQAVRMMKAQDPRGGRIINNGSISAHVPRPRQRRLHGDQARADRPDQVDLAGRPAASASPAGRSTSGTPPPR